jgi:hypothetical protein
LKNSAEPNQEKMKKILDAKSKSDAEASRGGSNSNPSLVNVKGGSKVEKKAEKTIIDLPNDKQDGNQKKNEKMVQFSNTSNKERKLSRTSNNQKQETSNDTPALKIDAIVHEGAQNEHEQINDFEQSVKRFLSENYGPKRNCVPANINKSNIDDHKEIFFMFMKKTD